MYTEKLKQDIEQEIQTMGSWMTTPSLQDKNLQSLSIPGTHNAASATIQGKVPSTVKGVAQCQNLSIKDQVKYGVRWFDIRLKSEKHSQGINIFASHTLNLCNMKELLKELSEVLAEDLHSKEVVILTLKGDHPEKLSEDSWRILYQQILCFFDEPKLITGGQRQKTLKELQEKGKRVLILCEDCPIVEELQGYNDFKNNTTFSWTKTKSAEPDKLLNNCHSWLTEKQNNIKGNKNFYILEAEVTPDAKTVTKNVLSFGKKCDLKSFGKETNSKLLSKLKDDWKELSLPVVTTDFVEMPLCAEIVKRNF